MAWIWEQMILLYPGTYIEEEMIPYIESALSGETIYSQEIVDTTWGHILQPVIQ